MLLSGDMTEVSEKGISLSGGQKQRMNICRAIYCDTDIQIFDGRRNSRTSYGAPRLARRVYLVTHALHFLPRVDYIFTIASGHIAERGTYSELMQKDREFSKSCKKFGNQEEKEEAIEDIGNTMWKSTRPRQLLRGNADEDPDNGPC
ncbi:P-loop containing nucleoside triphosphate hydrolase protein [Desarmillaria ectypa]|nr:P-loop containing nucleoside triphosphate hydrolase protein [Desarmillaria ectypa]